MRSVFKFDAGAFRERLKRLREGHLVVVHHEPDRVAAGTAGEAVIEGPPLVGHDGQGRFGVVMKRADADVLATLRLERHMFADQFHEIGGLYDPISLVIFESS